MAMQPVNLGAPISGAGGDDYRQAHTKINANFVELSTIVNAAVPSTQKGKANGVASLGADGKVPSAQLPAGVGDVTKADLENLKNAIMVGETGATSVPLVFSSYPETYIFPNGEATTGWQNFIQEVGLDFRGRIIPTNTGEVFNVVNNSGGNVIFIPLKNVNIVAGTSVDTTTGFKVLPNGTTETFTAGAAIKGIWISSYTYDNSFRAPTSISAVKVVNNPSFASVKITTDELSYRIDNFSGGGGGGGGDIEVLPANLVMPALEYIFYTKNNYICKTEKRADGFDYIMVSNNLGVTWTSTRNTLGDITFATIFGDGTLLICSRTKAYWSTDYITLNQSTVLDYNGSPLVASDPQFFCQQQGYSTDVINGVEMVHWGEYVLDDRPTRAWYSKDNGRTVKCSAKLGTTMMSGTAHTARHFHRIVWHKETESYYALVGDFNDQNAILKAKYNATADTWVWQVLNKGNQYKMSNLYMDAHYAYMLTDFTEANLKQYQGVYRVLIKDMGDFSKYAPVYKTNGAEWGDVAPMEFYMDEGSDVKIIFPDYIGEGSLWIALKGLDFKRVRFTPKVLLMPLIGRNYNGDFYAMAIDNSAGLSNADAKINTGCYNITKALRDIGVKSFAKYNPLVPR